MNVLFKSRAEHMSFSVCLTKNLDRRGSKWYKKHLRDHVHSIQQCKQVQVITLTEACSKKKRRRVYT